MNLCLSAECVSMLEKLRVAMHRPSMSNTTEAIIQEKATALHLAPNGAEWRGCACEKEAA